jgi:hypothetical protein
MSEPVSTYIITREDRGQDPVTLVTASVALGRLADNEVHLNHPTVSRLHAGIRAIGGRFFLFHLSRSNSTTLNGRGVEEREALADGDVIQIGPFFLTVHIKGRRINLHIHYQPAVRIGDAEVHPAAAQQGRHEPGATAPDTLSLFWDKRKREAGKIVRPSALRPEEPMRLGRTRHNWRPTRDLARPWPFALFTWAAVAVGLLSALAAYTYSNAYAPAPVSAAHARAGLTLAPAVAARPNANSCTTCHAARGSMESRCADCHRAEGFAPETTEAHAAAGVGCVTCHAEHRGRDFRPAVASLSADFQPGVAREQTCAGCHNDSNAKTYNGRRVSTPHGGTFGYPVVGGRWEWKGLGEADWAQKSEEVRALVGAGTAADENARRSLQFHALHLHRVRAVAGIEGNVSGELTCSSCHRSLGASLDRETPRTTCAACHAGRRDEQTGRQLVADGAPNCTSCHVQHPKDRAHFGASLLAAGAKY